MSFSNYKSLCKVTRAVLYLYLILSVILPVYHAHGYPEAGRVTGDYNSTGESLKNIYEGLSHGNNQSVAHIHLRKDFNRANASLELRKNCRTGFSIAPHMPLVHYEKCEKFLVEFKQINPNIIYARPFSGLSPPLC